MSTWTKFSIVPPHWPSTQWKSCLALSPNVSEVILVHERWRWDGCGSAVDPGQISMERVLKIVAKETRVKLDLEQMDSVRIGASNYQSRLEEVIIVIIFSFILYIDTSSNWRHWNWWI